MFPNYPYPYHRSIVQRQFSHDNSTDWILPLLKEDILIQNVEIVKFQIQSGVGVLQTNHLLM